MRKVLLGFDLLATTALATWVSPAVNREQYFLRPDVDWPISVDRVTCPSIFQPEYRSRHEAGTVLTRFPISGSLSTERQKLRALTHLPVDWSQSELNDLGLWPDFSLMQAWIKKNRTIRDLVRLGVTIQVYVEVSKENPWQELSESGRAKAGKSIPRSQGLGFDVADRHQNSFLSGYQHPTEELSQARIGWGDNVNKWGLLNELQRAVSYKDFANEKMSDQAPFYVYEVSEVSLE
jgi:hypothetical protein